MSYYTNLTSIKIPFMTHKFTIYSIDIVTKCRFVSNFPSIFKSFSFTLSLCFDLLSQTWTWTFELLSFNFYVQWKLSVENLSELLFIYRHHRQGHVSMGSRVSTTICILYRYTYIFNGIFWLKLAFYGPLVCIYVLQNPNEVVPWWQTTMIGRFLVNRQSLKRTGRFKFKFSWIFGEKM